MKKFHNLTVAVLCFLSSFATAQEVTDGATSQELTTTTLSGQVSFLYDDNGNRISRTLTLKKSAAADSVSAEQEKKADEIAGSKLLIYPNPAKETLHVDLSGSDCETCGRMELIDLGGKILRSLPLLSGSNTLDMSPFPPAVYLLSLTKDGQVNTWKIIKE